MGTAAFGGAAHEGVRGLGARGALAAREAVAARARPDDGAVALTRRRGAPGSGVPCPWAH